MGVTKIMIIRHAEKPGTYGAGNVEYTGINPVGQQDPESLVTMGWERAGGIANLFFPTNKVFQHKALASPGYIYAANPASKMEIQANGNILEKFPSQRPYQTISALYAKMAMPANKLNLSFGKDDFPAMITNVLALPSGIVLISWQHQDILPKKPKDDSIVTELLKQTKTPASIGVPPGPWPGNRYDMVFVFDRPSGKGPFTAFTQVPQMLLAGDSTKKI